MAANVGPWLHAGAVVVTFDRYGASGRESVAVPRPAAPCVDLCVVEATARRVDGEGDGWRKARRTQASNSSPGQDGTAVPRSRRRLIIDGASARWTWRAPPCARVRARAGRRPRLGVDGVQGAERVRDTGRRWRAGCRESARYCGGDGVRGAERGAHRACSSSLGARLLAALAAHASQLVWFRRLFVVFSAYTYANRLVVIE